MPDFGRVGTWKKQKNSHIFEFSGYAVGRDLFMAEEAFTADIEIKWRRLVAGGLQLLVGKGSA